MLVDFLAVVVLTAIGSWVVPGPTNELTLVVELVWLVPPERLTPEGRELAFPELCCPPLALGGANVTKEFVPLVPRGAGVRVDPITFDPKD
jgi:hypothetical protein